MTIETYTVTAPANWACYYINDDCGGMDDDEITAADRFAESLDGRIVSADGEEFFQRWFDAAPFYPYAAPCLEYTVIKD